MAASCWTDDRRKLIGKLVRRHAFDFDAVSEAFQEHLRGGGVDCSPEETSSTSLRKVFASLGRPPSTRTDGCSPLRRSREPPQLMRTSREGDKGGSNLEGTRCSPYSNLDDDQTINNQQTTTKVNDLDNDPDDSVLNTRRTHSSKPTDEESNRRSPPETTRHGVEPGHDEVVKGAETFGLRGAGEAPLDSSWTFETMLKEQRRKEVQHEAQKERTFQRVLSALGGSTADTEAADTAGLPPDVLLAWEARNDKLAGEARNTQLRQQKLKDDRELALQREALMQRHLPGSEDNVGEDPLATSPASQSAAPPARDIVASAGPVRLELGMDAEMLEKILDDLEENAAAGGYRETNSELSRILDVLDEAAGDVPATAALLPDAQGGRQ